MRKTMPLKNFVIKHAVFSALWALLLSAFLCAAELNAAVYYVNDNSSLNDIFCDAPGNDANDGLTPQSPVASFAKILSTHILFAGDTVFIDAGTYYLTANIEINSNHGGSSGEYVTIRGAGKTTLFNRQSQAAGSCCISNSANWIRFQNLTFTNSQTGLRVAAATCRNIEILENIFCGLAGTALEISSQTACTVAGTYTICRNLIYDSLHGVVKAKPAAVQPDDIVKVANNTISVTNGAAIVINSGSDFFDCYNNILVSDGGSCYETFSTNLNLSLNANNLWPRNGGTVAKMTWDGSVITVADLADWQRMLWDRLGIQAEPRSFSRDPAFAAPSQNDYSLKSFGGRWRPLSPAETNGEWIADQDQHSPCVDAGHPAYNDRLSDEPQPNGGRVNMGAYGGTGRASKSHTNRFLLAMAPDYGQIPQMYQQIFWNAVGQGWDIDDKVKIQYSIDGGGTWEIINSDAQAADGIMQWNRPESAFAATGCLIRVMSLADPSVQDAVWLPNRGGLIAPPEPAEYYINDTLSTYDIFCTAAGSDANDGLTAATPMANLQVLLNRYNPGRGSTIYVDAGTYALSNNIVLAHNGEPGSPSEGWLRLIGANRATVMDRQSAGSASACIEVWQDFTRIEGFTFRGAESGLTVCPQSCRNAEIVGNTFTANSGNGLTFLADTTSEGFDTYVIRNNLFFSNSNGMNLQGAQGFKLAYFAVENNTVVGYKGYGIHCAGRPGGTTLKNNIISMKNYGYCLSIANLGVLAEADHNCLHVYGDAGIAIWADDGTARKAAKIEEWQAASGLDTASISLDPLFAYPGSGNFHLKSTAGSWRGYTWYNDTVTSPCVDAGDPLTAVAEEPNPNGGRVNIGAYGNTPEASKTPDYRLLKLVYPSGGETFTNRSLQISWISFGSGWQPQDSVRIEIRYPTNTWWVTLSGAETLDPSGSHIWQIPNTPNAKETYGLRVVCNQNSAVYDQADPDISAIRSTVNYYVNDTLTAGDRFCTAPGHPENSGTSPESPLDSLITLLTNNAIKLGPGDTVYVDTGDYVRQQSTVMTLQNHSGTPDNPVRVIGTYGGSRLRNSSSYTNSSALLIQADHVRIEGLTCFGSPIGIAVNASSARHVTLAGNIVCDNTFFGIKIAPSGSYYGEEYQIFQNVVVNNGGDGVFLQGSPYTYSRTVFLLENNTICNPSNGIRLLNLNYPTKRTNFIKNNIVIATSLESACIVAYANSLNYSDHNNLYHAAAGPLGSLYTSGQQVPALFYSLTEWRAANNQDHNSTSSPVSFIDELNPCGHGFRLQSGSVCADAGIISFWMFNNTDPAGNPRVTGQTVDIGAYEFALRASVRCFLQGPFISGSESMSSALSSAGAIPQRSPYADDPRTVSVLPADVVDWVLLQFRLSINSPSVFSRSLFLRNDGWLVNEKGSSEFNVDLQATTNFHVSVKHRNHVAAISAEPAEFDGQTILVDFTASAATCFGDPETACVAVNGSNGERWALRAGDVDGDGTVRTVDLEILTTQTNQTGYLRGDINLDGAASNADNLLLQSNLFAHAAMPFPETPLLPALRVTPSRKTVAVGETVALLGYVSSSAATATADASEYQYPYGYGEETTASTPDSSPLNWSFVERGSGVDADVESYGNAQAVYMAGSQTETNDIIEAWNSSGAIGRAFMNVVGSDTAETAGKAVIIAGRTSSQDTLWPATDYLANTAYNTLRYRGFSKENLHYLSPEPDRDIDGNSMLDDIDDTSTFEAAELVFTNALSGSDRLFIYLVDHGGNSSGNRYFRLNGTETITSIQLGAWLDQLQGTHQTHVTVMLDFCYAGSFLPDLAYSGSATRIVIAACGDNQPSYFVAGGLVSFSGAFLSGVMLGYDIMQSFDMAQSAMSSYQSALLDDDKDGVYDPEIDGSVATGAYIGPSYISGGDAPQIGEACGNQILTEETSATLWIGSVESLHSVSNAWCLIIPPDHNPDPANPVTELPRLDLTYDSSSGRYTVTYDGFTAPGSYNVTFYVQDIEGNVSAPRYSYVTQIGYDDRVILVAGGNTNSTVWPAVENLTQLAYNTMRMRLFPSDNICVISPSGAADFDGDGTNDVNASTSLANLTTALTDWAASNSTDRLTVYMIGEGTDNNFMLNASELLTTNQFTGLISDFQNLNPVPVNIIMDFSGSGSFIPSLADPAFADEHPTATRIAIASTGSGRDALFANNGTVSFSQYLLAGIINGETLGDAYTAARRAIRRVSGGTRQRAEIDDNFNGDTNEKNVDGVLADATHIGCAFVTGADMPVIGAVIPVTTLAVPASSVTLWASEVAGMHPISNVWCTVTPPGFNGTADLPIIELNWNSTTLRYEAECAFFTLPGSYGLTFYALDTAGEISAPVQSEIILADAFEPDNSQSIASLYHGLPQIHNFHTSDDEDWIRFYLVTNLIYYDIETYHLSESLDTVIDLYQQMPDGSLELIDHVDEEGSDLGEYTGIDVTESGWYWARISPYAASEDTIGTYEFSVYSTAADGLNSLIILGLDDVYTSALPEGSTATVEGYGEVEFNGEVFVVCSGLTNGTYLVTVPVPENFIPRADPYTPDQIGSLTNIFYANPRLVTVEGGWAMAGFEMLSTIAVTSGVVRDAWTGAFLANAQIAFTAASGSLTGTVVDGSVILTSYRTPWLTTAGGPFPDDITLGACDWHLALALDGYHTNTTQYAVSNAAAGSQLNLGTMLMEPLDANANGVADAWEDLHFPSGLDPDADSDADGLSNKDEYFCGTNPNDPASVLRFITAEPNPGGMDLTWSVVGGRGYQVLAVTSLTAAASTTNGPWQAAHGQEQMQWCDTDAPLHNTRFYRIRLNPF
ncbi:MAG: right-handed parallel beta-helix repeat-containing protein [Kiritimatiellae bacterium]|nr:right-handed parallel beta-helix repeat-containing protein [Kiritimatiellia bacterium]